MMLMTCTSVRRRLQGFHDRELPVPEIIEVEGHLSGCPPCSAEYREIRAVGDALRLAAAPAPADDWAGLQSGVVSRMRAEDNESWRAHARRFVDDVHLVWIGLASATATIILAGSILSLLHTMPGRSDSLAAVFAMFGAPAGSDLNPAPLDGRGLNLGPTPVLAPTVPRNGVVFATLESLPMSDDVVVPLSLRVTRDGRVEDVEMLDRRGGPSQIHQIQQIVDGFTNARMMPAQYGGDPVAVSLVWLLAHTTVRPGKT